MIAWAILGGNLAVVKAIVDIGGQKLIHTNIQGSDEFCLHLAVLQGNADIVAWLLENGAVWNPDILETARDQREKFPEVSKIILERVGSDTPSHDDL